MDAVPLSGCSATAAAPAPAAAGPTALIVHLDLNKTVLMELLDARALRIAASGPKRKWAKTKTKKKVKA